ncbi:MAG: hypothetical protein PSN46_07060 [Gammaproteobacteria bacterium]|nr:hypothetical protein [Gammaproteobacteria bacterium]
MDAKRRKVFISLATSLVVGWWLVSEIGQWGSIETAALGQLLIKAIGLSIAANIAGVIIITLAVSLIWGKVDKDVTDERDAEIELYVMRLILVCFSMGLIVVFAMMGWQQLAANTALLSIYACMYAASIAGDLLKLFWYR